jgi:RNA polymerase sigma-54 factor
MAINVSVGLKTSLQQTLTPQQIQYLKLLQMPLIQFEQELKREIEENPLLEFDDEASPNFIEQEKLEEPPENSIEDIYLKEKDKNFELSENLMYDSQKDSFESAEQDEDYYFDDIKIKNEIPLSNYDPTEDENPFDFYSYIINEDSNVDRSAQNFDDDDEQHSNFQIKDHTNFLEELENQLFLNLNSEEEKLLGKHILWNVDDDGYLRRELIDIVKETNSHIAEINFELQKDDFINNKKNLDELSRTNPAYNYTVDDHSKKILGEILANNPDLITDDKSKYVREIFIHRNKFLTPVNLNQAETVLKLIQHLDPPGIASRNIQECLIAQANAITKPNDAQKNALKVLNSCFEEFSKKHFKDIMKKLNLSEDELKDAIEAIKKFNPKPGDGFSTPESNSIIPDFIIERDEKTNEPLVLLNDSSIPPVKLNTLYDILKKESKEKKYNRETKQWLRQKYDDAKFIIQAIQQRKITMLKIMGAIAGIERDFFLFGSDHIKPMIYKDVADVTGLDISTVCRIVNNKYVQTEFGTFELKYFFSEALPNDDGEEISTTIIKQKIKEMIDNEPKDKPLSDDLISNNLKELGFNVARRTVAKYREHLKIPVARLRKEL